MLTTYRKSYGVHVLFKEPIIGPIKSKMAEIGSWCQNAKMQFSQKLSSLELRCLLTTYRGFVYSADSV